jgi:hypothetical protein
MRSFLRHTFRFWTRTPLVAATIILTLAIAIGANTTVFSVLRAVLLDPLPYPDSSRLAILWTEDPAHDVHQEGVSYPNYADWRSMNHTFTEMPLPSQGVLDLPFAGPDLSCRDLSMCGAPWDRKVSRRYHAPRG